MKPLNGERTHPLSDFSRDELRRIERHPEPRQAFNAGVADRLLRGGLAESVELTSPYPTHKGRKIEHLQITAAGRASLTPPPRRVLMGGGL